MTGVLQSVCAGPGGVVLPKSRQDYVWDDGRGRTFMCTNPPVAFRKGPIRITETGVTGSLMELPSGISVYFSVFSSQSSWPGSVIREGEIKQDLPHGLGLETEMLIK